MHDDKFLAEIQYLQQKLKKTELPNELQDKVNQILSRLERMGSMNSYSEEYERASHYIDWIISLPWNTRSQDILDLEKTRQVLEKHHYGLQEVKERFLEYVSVLKLRSSQAQTTQSNTQIVHAPVLLLVGLVGTGKTTFAYSLAEALGRQVVRIPFGGMTSAKDLRGQSRLYLESEPGYVIKSLRKANTKNPVILLDEIDRVAEHARGEIMGVLVELLDPEQNMAFTDHYLDYPFDLSSAIFIATANNTEKIATAVVDRLEIISMPSYTDEEKIQIGKLHLFPKALASTGLSTQALSIEDTVWSHIVRPLGYDAGIRTLQRTIHTIARKVAKKIVEGSAQAVVLNESNIKEYLSEY